VGFDDGIAAELQQRARSFLEEQDESNTVRRRELGVDDELAAVDGLSTGMLVKLGESGIKTLDQLGDLASDELKEILGDALTPEQADAIILAARAHWFDGEEKSA
jgi:N utilization substance protein A